MSIKWSFCKALTSALVRASVRLLGRDREADAVETVRLSSDTSTLSKVRADCAACLENDGRRNGNWRCFCLTGAAFSEVRAMATEGALCARSLLGFVNRFN